MTRGVFRAFYLRVVDKVLDKGVVPNFQLTCTFGTTRDDRSAFRDVRGGSVVRSFS